MPIAVILQIQRRTGVRVVAYSPEHRYCETGVKVTSLNTQPGTLVVFSVPDSFL